MIQNNTSSVYFLDSFYQAAYILYEVIHVHHVSTGSVIPPSRKLKCSKTPIRAKYSRLHRCISDPCPCSMVLFHERFHFDAFVHPAERLTATPSFGQFQPSSIHKYSLAEMPSSAAISCCVFCRRFHAATVLSRKAILTRSSLPSFPFDC